MSFVTWLKILPLRLLSLSVGAFMALHWPKTLQNLLNFIFVQSFGIDMREAGAPLESYRSLGALFTRELRPGVRPLHGPLISPCDGTLVRSMPVSEDGLALQVKGITYALHTLIGQTLDKAKHLELAWYTTIYLAPHNYHRVHLPCAADLVDAYRITGANWPVNQRFVKWVPALFNANERVVFELSADPSARIFVVMIGALNVASIESPFLPRFRSNGIDGLMKRPGAVQKLKVTGGEDLAVGAHLGTFGLGSTVVMILNKAALLKYPMLQISESRPILLGSSLLKSRETPQ